MRLRSTLAIGLSLLFAVSARPVAGQGPAWTVGMKVLEAAGGYFLGKEVLDPIFGEDVERQIGELQAQIDADRQQRRRIDDRLLEEVRILKTELALIRSLSRPTSQDSGDLSSILGQLSTLATDLRRIAANQQETKGAIAELDQRVTALESARIQVTANAAVDGEPKVQQEAGREELVVQQEEAGRKELRDDERWRLPSAYMAFGTRVSQFRHRDDVSLDYHSTAATMRLGYVGRHVYTEMGAGFGLESVLDFEAEAGFRIPTEVLAWAGLTATHVMMAGSDVAGVGFECGVLLGIRAGVGASAAQNALVEMRAGMSSGSVSRCNDDNGADQPRFPFKRFGVEFGVRRLPHP